VTGSDTDVHGTYFRPSIIMSTATSGDGASLVVDEIHAHMQHLIDHNGLDRRRRLRTKSEVRSRSEQLLLSRLAAELASSTVTQEIDAAIDNNTSPVDLAAAIVRRITDQ